MNVWRGIYIIATVKDLSMHYVEVEKIIKTLKSNYPK